MSQHRLISFLRLLLAASIVAPLALFGFFTWHSYRTEIRNAHERADRFSLVVREHASKVFETIGLTLENVAHTLQYIPDGQVSASRDLWEKLRGLQQQSEQVGAIFITRADGTPFLTTRAYPAPTVNFSERDYFARQKEADQGLFIGRSYVGGISKEPIFNFSVRKNGPNGEFGGIIGISAYVSYFHDYYRSIGRAADNIAVTLLREDGQVLVRYPASAGPLQVSTTGKSFFPLTQNDHGTFEAASLVDATDKIVGFARVKNYPVFALYSIDRNVVMTGWLKASLPGAVLSVLAAACLSCACFFALGSARRQQQASAALDRTNQKLESEMTRRAAAEASLMQSQRLEAIGQLTGGIAHDFNNLLMVIAGNLDLADRRINEPSALARKIKTIRYATERAKALTQQLLGFARRHSTDAKTVDLNSALEKARTLIAYSLPENVKLDIRLAPVTCPVRIDVSEFEAAILNLVGNARDAMPSGGALSISTSVSTDGGATPAHIELRVEDTGQGISEETLQRVYEPFFTTKPTGKGTGLGLSQVYGFVQQSGGKIEITSEVGVGTCVSLKFSKSVEEPERADLSQATQLQQDNVRTILVVERDAELRRVAMAMLEDLGHQVLVARNSAEALALIHAGYPIHVLFVNVALNDGLSGIELAEQAVKESPSLKVLLTTAYPGGADLLKQDEFSVLAKPYSRVTLAEAIQALHRTGGDLQMKA